MKVILMAAMAVAVALAMPPTAEAQRTLGFLAGGFTSDYNQQYPTINGGVLVNMADSWVAAGAQGDMFFSNGYAAGRGGLIGVGRIVRRGTFRPFLLGGYLWGEDAGCPVVGAGMEIWSASRIGFRADVQDCQRRFQFNSKTVHRPSLHFGIVWR